MGKLRLFQNLSKLFKRREKKELDKTSHDIPENSHELELRIQRNLHIDDNPINDSTVIYDSGLTVEAPTEIWYMILEEVIHIPYIFDTGCSWQTYLSFQQAMTPFMDHYRQTEKYLDTLERVCTAWRQFAQTHRGRWKWFYYYNTDTEFKPADFQQCIRIDFNSRMIHPGLLCLAKDYSEQNPCPVKFLGGQIALQNAQEGEQTIDLLFTSPRNLPRLEALDLNLNNLQDVIGIFDRVSEAFPQLLLLDIGLGQSGAPQLGVLRLPHLELLSIRYFASAEHITWTIPTYSNFSSWYTPQLRNILFPVEEDVEAADRLFKWISSIAPKLEIIELAHRHNVVLPKAFWSWFPNVRLMCANWANVDMTESFYPQASHPLCAISTPLNVTERPEFIEMLKKWQTAARKNDGVKEVPMILVSGDIQANREQSHAVKQFCKETGVVLRHEDRTIMV